MSRSEAPSAAIVANSCRRSLTTRLTKSHIAAAARTIAKACSSRLIPVRSTVVIELTVCTACWRMSLTATPKPLVAAATRAATAAGSSRGLGEDDVGPAGAVGLLQVGEVGDHERVARRRGELLHGADDVEGDDPEPAAAVVEHPQPQQVAGLRASSR